MGGFYFRTRSWSTTCVLQRLLHIFVRLWQMLVVTDAKYKELKEGSSVQPIVANNDT